MAGAFTLITIDPSPHCCDRVGILTHQLWLGVAELRRAAAECAADAGIRDAGVDKENLNCFVPLGGCSVA